MLHVLFAVALGSATVASDSRCNGSHTDTIQGELQNFAQHPASASAQTQRGVAIVEAQSDAEQEEVVLQGVCPENEFPTRAARLYALDAWADLLIQRNGAMGSAVCPDAEKKVMAAIAASAWFKLANAATISPKPPALVATLVPQVQALAAQAAMTLPAFNDATSYWEQQYKTAAQQAIIDCASQTPRPEMILQIIRK
jgi:hypothetical protein